MTVSMYTVSAPIFIQFLGRCRAFSTRRRRTSTRRNSMNPSSWACGFIPTCTISPKQVRASCDHAVNACARIAGVDLPAFENNETSIAELKARIEKAIAFVRTIKPEQLDGDGGQGNRRQVRQRRAPLHGPERC
jgi:uncharacterized protein